MACNNNVGGNNQALARHLCDLIGETVTIFTNSGGPAGYGFTGCLLSVNCDFCRLLTQPGSAPLNPVVSNGGTFPDNVAPSGCYRNFQPGTICDIPLDKITVVCHNAL